MSLRSLIRILALSAISLPLGAALWGMTGPWLLLAGPALLLFTVTYLVTAYRCPALTRWQLRYHLPTSAADQESPRLEATLQYLAARSWPLVLGADAGGLYLELPRAFDRYVEAQLPGVLPEVKLARTERAVDNVRAKTSLYLSLSAPDTQVLAWAVAGQRREARIHIHAGGYVILLARSDKGPLPGTWLRLPGLHGLDGVCRHLPVWDELSAGMPLSPLLPTTDADAVFSSRPRLLGLVPADDYQPATTGRKLGWTMDNRPLIVDPTAPLFTTGAPASFLAGQVADDLARNALTVVVSPDRRFLEQLHHGIGTGIEVQRLDPQNSQASVHLGIVPAAEWPAHDTKAIIPLALTFLGDLGLDVDLPAIQRFSEKLLLILSNYSRQSGRDLAFTDLYAISQSTRALHTFLWDLCEENFARGADAIDHVYGLRRRMGSDDGYVQTVTILSALRTALAPLRSGPLHTLCQAPYLSTNGAPPAGARLLLVPMTNVDYPQHDRLLGAMLDLTLTRFLAKDETHHTLALHLHDPHCYRPDGGQRWIDAARHDPRVSLLLNVADPDHLPVETTHQAEPTLVFRCSEALARTLVRDWHLPATAQDLLELPPGVAVALLDGMTVALRTEED